MAHRSFYRTYRPQTFDDVVGQDHITRTLRNAVREGTVSHAYLFAGPRGTGKTTTARILAKALLCESGPTPDPDGTCEQCRDISEGRHPDVYELDAASRTGVENVREEIIGRVAFAPSRGRGKVYVIDEVHMLSVSAFNALLKTIEEPPSHVYFVLCTTNPSKVLETVQSRCQRFDFHRISVEHIVTRLETIAGYERIKAAEGAFTLIAKHAMGGMRDAISTLEQLAAFTEDDIALADVEGLLGEVDAALLFELADLIAERDVAGGFRFVARLVESGVDPAEFVRDLTGHYRDLFVVASVGDARGIVDTTQEDIGRLASQAKRFGAERLARCLDLLGELSAEVRWSSDPRLALEVALTRMARPRGELTLEALDERLALLETRDDVSAHAGAANAPRSEPASTPDAPPHAAAVLANGAEQGATTPSEGSGASSGTRRRRARTEVEVREAAAPAGPLERAAVRRAWPAVLQELRKLKLSRAHLFSGTEADVDPDGTTLVVEFPADQRFALERARDPESLQVLRRALAAVLGASPPVRFQLGRGRVRPEMDEIGKRRRNDVPPATTPDETGGMPPVVPDAEGTHELERRLIDDLGAEIVVEHGREEAD